jgi:Tfp pilus assembly protein PilF
MSFKKVSLFYLSIGLLSGLIILNSYFFYLNPSNPILAAKWKMSSLSKGEQYTGRLQLWQIYAQAGDWDNAAKLESQLDNDDYSYYKDSHQPEIVKKNLNQLMTKPNKTPDDWIQLSQYYLLIGNTIKAREALTQAQKLDPVRTDLESLIQLFPLQP